MYKHNGEHVCLTKALQRNFHFFGITLRSKATARVLEHVHFLSGRIKFGLTASSSTTLQHYRDAGCCAERLYELLFIITSFFRIISFMQCISPVISKRLNLNKVISPFPYVPGKRNAQKDY